MAATKRLRCSRAADVAFLEQAVEGWLGERGARDLCGLARGAEDETWRTAPRVSTLVSFAGLLTKIVAKATPHVVYLFRAAPCPDIAGPREGQCCQIALVPKIVTVGG